MRPSDARGIGGRQPGRSWLARFGAGGGVSGRMEGAAPAGEAWSGAAAGHVAGNAVAVPTPFGACRIGGLSVRRVSRRWEAFCPPPWRCPAPPWGGGGRRMPAIWGRTPAKSRLSSESPPPLEGGGWGEGSVRHRNPSPNPSPSRGGGAKLLSSPPQAQPADQRLVAAAVLGFQVVQQPPAAADQHQQATAGMEILRVGLQMLGQVADPLGQQGDLDLRAAGVVGAVAYSPMSAVRRSAVIDIVLVSVSRGAESWVADGAQGCAGLQDPFGLQQPSSSRHSPITRPPAMARTNPPSGSALPRNAAHQRDEADRLAMPRSPASASVRASAGMSASAVATGSRRSGEAGGGIVRRCAVCPGVLPGPR